MDAKQDKLTRMTTQPVKKLILRLAGPTIASMLISSPPSSWGASAPSPRRAWGSSFPL